MPIFDAIRSPSINLGGEFAFVKYAFYAKLRPEPEMNHKRWVYKNEKITDNN